MRRAGRACVLLRDGLHYRKNAFEHGLKVLGYQTKSYVSDPGADDVLVIWNRSFRGAEDADRFARGGARVVVAENGLFGKEWRGGNWYSLALNHVAGAGGDWLDSGPSRWESFDVQLQPWRTTGSETVVLGQRSIGEPGIKSPVGWEEKQKTLYGARIRAHPGRMHSQSPPLEKDLANASQVITWASSSALQALLMGIPVFYGCPTWCGKQAARPLSEFGQQPKRDDESRLALFRRLAWAIWTIDQIDDGSAFYHLLMQ